MSLELHQGTLAPLELQPGTRASTLVAMGISGFHSSWGGTQGSSRLAVGPPLMLPWGNSSLAGMFRVAPVLLQCVGGYSLVLTRDYCLLVVGVNSVVVVGSILSSCGVQAPL